MEMLVPFAATCHAGCVASGWSVQVLAILATVGHKDLAVEETQKLPPSVFETPGGNGHSQTNTIWYISTRPEIDAPYPFDEPYPWGPVDYDITCNQPITCTDDVLNTIAGDYLCGGRIEWLIEMQGLSEFDACVQIAVNEFPTECGACKPTRLEPDYIDQGLTCSQPATCTADVLNSMAEGFSCGGRIRWVIGSGLSEWDACIRVAVEEFPAECGLCNPTG
jgi:hypothetical protein